MKSSSIKEALGWDDFVFNMIKSEADRLKTIPLTARHPFFFYGLLALVSNIIFPLIGLKRRVQTNNEDFLLISCPDTVFRTQSIGLVAGGLKFSIIYLPNFHIQSAIRYRFFFKKAGINAYFPTIKIWQVIASWRLLRTLIDSLNGKDDSFEAKNFKSVLSTYLIYDYVAKDFIGRERSFKGKWLLEHQKFYFLPSVANLHFNKMESTMLQHGIFFQPVYDYIPLLCDNVLCCSEREKYIYINNGISPERIVVLGAPLQTLGRQEEALRDSIQFELLIIMTIVDEANIMFLVEVLDYIRKNYDNVLVRLRPRSRKNDLILLGKSLMGMTLSKEGTSIGDDIIKCRKVISFSLDASIEVAKKHKPFVFIWDEKDSNGVTSYNCATRDNYKQEIEKLMDQEYYCTFFDNQINDILGETDVNLVHNRFVSFIKR